MDELRIILLIIGGLIILFNFFINSANIIKIVGYCFQTNTIGKFWELFFKSSASFRAPISTIISLLIAIPIFIIITPIILIKGSIEGKKTTELLNEGLLFEYHESTSNTIALPLFTNITSVISLDVSAMSLYKNIKTDALLIISEIEKQCKFENKSFNFKIMHSLLLHDKKEAKIPLFLTIDGINYPAYFIYDEIQKIQFEKIKTKLYNIGFKDCFYFSVLKM